MKIFKYVLCARFTTGPVTVAMPQHADILSVDVQGETAVVWAIVNPTRPIEARRFQLVPTGAELPRGCALPSFVGTVQFLETLHNPGPLVLHVFKDTQ